MMTMMKIMEMMITIRFYKNDYDGNDGNDNKDDDDYNMISSFLFFNGLSISLFL